jgi:hypothetical protein
MTRPEIGSASAAAVEEMGEFAKTESLLEAAMDRVE